MIFEQFRPSRALNAISFPSNVLAREDREKALSTTVKLQMEQRESLKERSYRFVYVEETVSFVCTCLHVKQW